MAESGLEQSNCPGDPLLFRIALEECLHLTEHLRGLCGASFSTVHIAKYNMPLLDQSERRGVLFALLASLTIWCPFGIVARMLRTTSRWTDPCWAFSIILGRLGEART
eukprot:scaffold5337_cov167-Amphora_coffeaeformis.AAC.16